MQPTALPTIRELDHRSGDGIDVKLLWNPSTGSVSIEVSDEFTDESFHLALDPADALDAFHHPYAYVGFGHGDQLAA
jgi:hypothetical protein